MRKCWARSTSPRARPCCYDPPTPRVAVTHPRPLSLSKGSTIQTGSSLEDRLLPGLGLLVADEPLRAWLAERGEVLKRRTYLRYKPGTSCVAALTLASGPAFILAVSAAAQAKLDKYVVMARPGDVLALDAGRRLMLVRFTADRDLPALHGLEASVCSLLPDLGAVSIETLVHKPQRRWVGLATTGRKRRSVLLRAYRTEDLAPSRERLDVAQRAANAVRVPRLMAASTASALLAVEYLPGRSLDAALADQTAKADVAAAGEALARVHQSDSAGLSATDLAGHDGTANLVATLRPNLAQRVTGAVAALARSAAPYRAASALCHGDFSLDQVIVDDAGQLALVDWDRAGIGNPAADLASACAAGLDDHEMQELLTGYSRVAPVPPDLSWHLASARMQRLAEPFRLASPNWKAEIQERLAVIESSLP